MVIRGLAAMLSCHGGGVHRGHDDVTKRWSTGVRLEDRIAFLPLSVPPPELEVPPPATGNLHCL